MSVIQLTVYDNHYTFFNIYGNFLLINLINCVAGQ